MMPARSRLLSLATVGLVTAAWGAGSTAQADCSIELTPGTASAGARGEFTLTGATGIVGVDVELNGCTVHVEGSTVTVLGERCAWVEEASFTDDEQDPQQFLGDATHADELRAACPRVVVHKHGLSEVGGQYSIGSAQLRLAPLDAEIAGQAITRVVVPMPARMRGFDVASRSADLTNDLAAVAEYMRGVRTVYLLYGQTWYRARLQPAGNDCDPDPSVESWCRAEGASVFYCLDATSGHIDAVRNAPSVIRPDSDIIVVVRTCPGDVVEVGSVGEHGDGSSQALDMRQPESSVGVQGAPTPGGRGALSERPPSRVNVGRFRPGSVVVRARFRGQPDWEWSSSLHVTPTYWGALRIGVGGVFGELAVPDAYLGSTAPGSMQRELMSRDTYQAAVEIVIGGTAYLPFNRSHLLRRPEDIFGVYAGFGVISAQPETGLSGFTSIYLGLEIEIIPQLSIVIAGVLRRANHLADNYRIGAPLLEGDAPTTERWGPGVGVVLNVSPDLFRFTQEGER